MSYIFATTTTPPPTTTTTQTTTIYQYNTTPSPGAGTVSPISTTPSPGTADDNTFGLSTQLIIWGMVGFILFELIAIGCLLRYCCRARYLRRRKFKEKEIILSDLATNNIFRNQYQSKALDSSQTNLISESQMQFTNINMDTTNQSFHSQRPVLYTQQQDQNDTVMVDDIMSDYSVNLAGGKNKNGTHRSNLTAAADRMRQELNSEDIYTLKFSNNAPIEPFDVNSPTKHHQSYMYNGSLNRPAFEIISHADVRPTTPIRFEQARDLTHSDEEYIYNERPHYHKKRNSRRSRAHTTPIHLNYGNQEMVNNTGKPVEWQMARELRTTDWDKLRRTYAYDGNNVHSFRFSGNDTERGGYLTADRPSKSTSYLNSYYESPTERYQYRAASPVPPTIAAGGEPSKNSLYTNYLLDRSPKLPNRSSHSFSNRQNTSTNNKNSYINNNSDKNNDLSSTPYKSGIYETNIPEQSEQYELRRDGSKSSDKSGSNIQSGDRKGTLLKKVLDPETNEVLSVKRINSSISNNNTPYTNNFNNIQDQNTRHSYESPEETLQEGTELDHSNVSVIDITYQTQKSAESFKLDSEHLDEDNIASLPIPTLPPPLGFNNNNQRHDSINQRSTNSQHDTDTKQNITNVSVINVHTKRDSVVSSTNYKQGDSEVDYDEEYFKTSNEATMPNPVSEVVQNRISISQQGNQMNSFKSSLNQKPSLFGNDSESKPGDLLSEIKSFNSTSLRPASKLSDQPMLYEKNIDLLHSQQDNNDSQRSRSEYQSLKKHEEESSEVIEPDSNMSAGLF